MNFEELLNESQLDNKCLGCLALKVDDYLLSVTRKSIKNLKQFGIIISGMHGALKHDVAA